MNAARESSPRAIRASRASHAPVSSGDARLATGSASISAMPIARRHQLLPVAHDVVALEQRLDDRRARRRRAEAAVLHRGAQRVVVDRLAGGLHRAEQRRLGVARRRRGLLRDAARTRRRAAGPRRAAAAIAAGSASVVAVAVAVASRCARRSSIPATVLPAGGERARGRARSSDRAAAAAIAASALAVGARATRGAGAGSAADAGGGAPAPAPTRIHASVTANSASG